MFQPQPAPVAGALMAAIAALVALGEWGGGEACFFAANLLLPVLAALLAPSATWDRRVFLLLGVAMALAAVATRPDWREMLARALSTGAFIAAFFTALSTLRTASATSGPIQTCGAFLARQPPARRYAALTIGGHLFALPLNYGALLLLGGMAEAQARREADPEIRRLRTRRMLLAVQRGMVSTLAWSPLAFAMAISLSAIEGARWAEAAGPCLVSAALIAGLGWLVDWVFRPRLAAPPSRPAPEGGWLQLWPLLALLAVLTVCIGGLHLSTGVRVVAVVMLVAPLLSAAWIYGQSPKGEGGAALRARARDYVLREAPQTGNELLLLIMAGFIGALGAQLLGPLAAASGADLSFLGGPALLAAIVCFIPLTGQLGMNPILSVSLFAPMLPRPDLVGLEPADLIVALTGGWALSAASSPFTATTMLIGRLGQASAYEVGLRWNGVFTLVCAAALSAWAVVASSL